MICTACIALTGAVLLLAGVFKTFELVVGFLPSSIINTFSFIVLLVLVGVFVYLLVSLIIDKKH